MGYSIEDLKNSLDKIKKSSDGIICTEHYFQKLGHRSIADDLVESKLLFANPTDIQKLSESPDYFVITFKLDKTVNLYVIVKLFNLNSLILITAVWEVCYEVR